MRVLLLVALVCVATARAEDVAIVGATPAGVATAIAAARSGASVVLIEESAHVGGIVSGGLTNTDIRKRGAVGGLFTEFTHRIRDYYAKTYGADSEQVKTCDDGNMFEPKVAELVFREMLASEKVEVRAVNVPDVQREILQRGGVVLYEDAPLRPEGR